MVNIYIATAQMRAYADNPAASGFVPIHPDTLRAWAELLEAVQAERNAALAGWTLVDRRLSGILHELAGAASMCWLPNTGSAEFDSTRACELVAVAIAEIRELAGCVPKNATPTTTGAPLSQEPMA